MNAAETALRGALTDAMRRRDAVATSVLRTTIGSLGNAEAVAVPETAPSTTSEHVAGAHVGLGAAEADRRELTDSEAWAVVAAEADELESAAASWEGNGQTDRAAELRAQADVLRRLVPGG
jgi:uncharacterized protein YqeY